MATQTHAFPFLLKSVVEKFYLWKESSSDKAWALEKMKDVLIKEIEKNPHLLSREDCVFFTKSFIDDDHDDSLLVYPDFVMIEVSRMLTGIMVNSSVVEDRDITVMLKLLRSVVSHGQLNKGQRVSVMFECMRTLFCNGSTAIIDQMAYYEFDASFALLFAVAGAQNYTRKSASTYLIELLKFAYNDHREAGNQEKACWKETRSSLKDNLSQLFSMFNSNLMESCLDSPSHFCLDIAANYCWLLTACVENCLEWGSAFAFAGDASDCMFGIWCQLLQTLNSHKYLDIADIAVSSIKQLAVVVSERDDASDREAAFEALESIIMKDFSDPQCLIGVNDLVKMACSVVSRWSDGSLKFPNNPTGLLDLSILPLLVILGVQLPLQSNTELSLLINRAQKGLTGKTSAKFSCLILGGIRDIFHLAENVGLVNASCFASVLRYFTFKTGVCPSEVSHPLLRDGEVSSKRVLVCLLHGFSFFKDAIENPCRSFQADETDNIQTYIAPVLNFRGISHRDLTKTLDCYCTLLNYMEKSGMPIRRDCVRSVLEGLELHLVNPDANLREVAVKGLGQLCLFDSAMIQEEMASARSLPSLWKCVKDREENVVTQVFEFILGIAEGGIAERLKETLSRMETNEEELKDELQRCLLSSQWDLIKSVAFSLLACVCSPSDVFCYAEVCVHRASCLATPRVFDYVNGLFIKARLDCYPKDDLKSKIDRLCDLLLQGWGDLVLATVNGENTTCLRYAVDILMSMNEFLTRDEIADHVNEWMTSCLVHCENVEGACLSDRIALLKQKMVLYTKEVLKGSRFVVASDGMNERTDELLNDPGQSQHDMRDEEELTEVYKNSVELNGEEEDCVTDHLDSTAQPQPLTLNKTLPILPETVNRIAGSGLDNSVSKSRLLVLVGFRQILNLLPLTDLCLEAHRSTDEYERNSDTILLDINHVIDSGLGSRTRQIEKEVVDIFLSEHLEVLGDMAHNEREDNNNKCLNSLIKLRCRVKNFSQLKDSFCQFVLSKRKTVSCRKKIDGKNLTFNPDFFNYGIAFVIKDFLSGVSTKDFYSSLEGLKQLLDMFFTHNVRKRAPSGDEKSKCEELPNVKVPRLENAATDVNSGLSPSPSSSDGCQAAMFYNVKQIKEAEELIKKSKRCERLGLILKLMLKSLATCVEMKNYKDKKNVIILTALQVTMDELKEWQCEEEEADGFDSDGDNDPTLIDCY